MFLMNNNLEIKKKKQVKIPSCKEPYIAAAYILEAQSWGGKGNSDWELISSEQRNFSPPQSKDIEKITLRFLSKKEKQLKY